MRFHDALSGKYYELKQYNAQSLSKSLKSVLVGMGIDYNKYNTDIIYDRGKRDEDKNIEKKPPAEIYEYQNLFLLEKDGQHLILDGFRRLLWYNAPDMNVNVRVYRYEDFTDSELLTLMVRLNNWKFYGSGSYHDRGFALLMKTVYNINILNFSGAFDGYLYGEKTKYDYGLSVNSSKKAEAIKQRITNDMFISDMRFLETINNCGGMVNVFFGALVYKFRKDNPDKVLDSSVFIEMTGKKVIQDLMPKYIKLGNDISSSQSQKIINQITELYAAILMEMNGKKAELTFAEKVEQCKKQVELLKKDKKYTLLSSSKLDTELSDKLLSHVKNGGIIDGKVVIIPTQDTNNVWGTSDRIGVTVLELTRRGNPTGNHVLQYTCTFDKTKFKIANQSNWAGFNQYTTKYYATAQEIKKGYSHSRELKAYLFIIKPEGI